MLALINEHSSWVFGHFGQHQPHLKFMQIYKLYDGVFAKLIITKNKKEMS